MTRFKVGDTVCYKVNGARMIVRSVDLNGWEYTIAPHVGSDIAAIAKEDELTSWIPTEFRKALTGLINEYSLENGSDTPDFMLADYLVECIKTFNDTTKRRDVWFNHKRIAVLPEGDPPEADSGLKASFDQFEQEVEERRRKILGK